MKDRGQGHIDCEAKNPTSNVTGSEHVRYLATRQFVT